MPACGSSLQSLGLGLPAAVLASPAASILLPITLGSAVGWSLSPSLTRKTYSSLRQPPFRPPPALFAPTWTLLYALSGYSIHHFHTLHSPHPAYHATTALYSLQLGLNLLWTPLFFGLERPALALLDIAALTGCVTALAHNYFSAGDRIAGYLTLPYLAWLSFAAYLNVGVGVLNDWELTSKRVAADKPGKADEKH